METEKLYYKDCHLSEFTAKVLSCEKNQQGFDVVLNRTAFYPEGGGQASDVGFLGDVPVIHVREDGDQVVHLCSMALEPGQEVPGKIDYDHRFDLMQQHSGEHIISGLIHEKYGCHNTGFHMGADVITIDFDGVIPPEDLPELEKKANQAVWKNLPLHIWYPTEEELPTVPYRTKRALPWPVRVVEIPGYDICACCGVHVERTGEIGLIKLLSCVKFRNGVRMEMICGGRALTYLTLAYEQNIQVSRAFSAKPGETGEAARRINELLEDMKYKMTAMRLEKLEKRAESCTNAGDVLMFEPGLDSGELRRLGELAAEACGKTAAVFSGEEGRGYGYCLVCRGGNLRELCTRMNGELGGRGGGKPEFQQGSLKAGEKEIREFFREFTLK